MEKDNTKLLDLEKRKTAIAVMLDIQGTLDNIDDQKANLFIKQLHTLRMKYGTEKIIINLSSNIHSERGLIPFLEILQRNLLPNIILDDATYLFGTYNYESGYKNEIGWGYNLKKIDLFEAKYLDRSEYDIIGLGIIDDRADPSYIEKHKDNRPVFTIRPSQKDKESLKYDNLMCYSTETFGFDGVLECLDTYLKRLKDVPADKVVEEQQKELMHLGALEVRTLCIKKKFDLLYRFIKENKLDEEDYERVARELNYLIKEKNIEKNELNILKKLIEALIPHIEKDNELLCFNLKNI